MRDMDDETADAVASNHVRWLFLVFLDFQSDPLYAASSLNSVEWGGHTWLGLGRVGGIEPIEETVEGRANVMTLRLSGVPEDQLSKAIGDRYQGRAAELYAVPLDSGYSFIGTPVLLHRGRMDSMPIEIEDGTATITVTVVNRLADWERPRLRRYTDEDQQVLFPGDLGCQFVPQMADKELVWGRG